MKTLTVLENDTDKRLDKFLTQSLPALPRALMYKYIRLKRIKVNGARAEASSRLKLGDEVTLYINDEFFEIPFGKYDFMSASKSLCVVYEDKNILLLNKPAGLLSHPDETEYDDTLITRVKRHLYEKGEYLPDRENSFSPSLANRIDRNTHGIVIAAKNAESLRVLNEKIKSRELHKYYLCVVHGEFSKNEETLHGWLCKDEGKNKVKVFNKPREGAKGISTKYRVLESFKGLSLVEVELHTGRTHQIRAHLAAAGHPLLGDRKYGINETNKKRACQKQFLCSYKIIFDFQKDAGILNYLNKKTFEIQDVGFVKDFKKRKLWQG